jgi:hypothetical protein
VSVGLLSAGLSGAPASGQTAGDAFEIAYGDTVADGSPAAGAGNIDAGGAVDSYTFDAEAGDVAIFDVLAGGAGVFRWRLEAPDGTELFDTLYVDLSMELPEAGTYTLTVRGANATTVGVYSFHLLLTPPPEEFTIAFGDTVSDGVPEPGAGNVEVPGAIDRYLFEGAAGQVAIFDALIGSTNEVRWSLHAPDGTEVFDAFYTDQQATLPQTGTYTLTVSGLNITRFGSYSFELVDVPPPPEEFTIAFGDTVSDGVPEPGAGNVEVPGAVDNYLFAGAAGQVAIFDVLSGSTNAVRWSLHAPDDTELFDAFYTDQQITLPQTGTYMLTVSGLTPTRFGAYSFELREAAANSAPVAEADAAETAQGVPVTVDVLANDSDPDGDDLALDAVTQPGDGTAAIDGDQITYRPDTGFAGTDSFAYTVADGRGGSAGATVTVTVREPADTSPVTPGTGGQGNGVTPQANAAPGLDLEAASLTRLKARPRTFAAAGKGGSVFGSRRIKVGTTLTYRLSEDATVTFKVQRRNAGRRVAGKCRKRTRANNRRRKCHLQLRGGFKHAGKQGGNSLRFSGRLRGRKLRPGQYFLVATARDAAGNVSVRKRARIGIVTRR